MKTHELIAVELATELADYFPILILTNKTITKVLENTNILSKKVKIYIKNRHIRHNNGCSNRSDNHSCIETRITKKIANATTVYLVWYNEQPHSPPNFISHVLVKV